MQEQKINIHELIQGREDTEGKEIPFLMLSLPRALMDREREVCLESQAIHDILLDTCSRNGDVVEAEPLWTWEVTVQKTRTLLEELDIICREESKVSVATSPPPAFIHHLNVSDDVIWIKGDLITSLWRKWTVY